MTREQARIIATRTICRVIGHDMRPYPPCPAIAMCARCHQGQVTTLRKTP